MDQKRMYLIAEYCDANFYTGWHLYLRDNNKRQQPNANGEWGWIRRIGVDRWGYRNAGDVLDFLATLGITIKGDGTCDDAGIGEFARRFPLGRQRIGGKPRGCVEVIVKGNWNIVVGLAIPAQVPS